jgi:hypothetical protein
LPRRPAWRWGRPYLLPLAAIVFFAGQGLHVVAAVGLTHIRFAPGHVAALLGLYILLPFWDLIALLAGLPFIALTIVLGPFTTVVFVLSVVVLGVYAVERVIGYDIQGITTIVENPRQALATLGVCGLSLLVLIGHYGRHEGGDWLLERVVDRIWGLRQRLQGRVQSHAACGTGMLRLRHHKPSLRTCPRCGDVVYSLYHWFPQEPRMIHFWDVRQPKPTLVARTGV